MYTFIPFKRYWELFFFSFLGCKTIKGADPNALCIFPFRYRDKTRDTCIGITNNQAWCSTKVDSLGNHVLGKWGNCGQGCPFPEIENGKLFSNFSTIPNYYERFVIYRISSYMFYSLDKLKPTTKTKN